MTRKRQTFFLATLFFLALAIAVPAAARAASLDVNGERVTDGVQIENGVTLVSQDILESAFYLDCERDGKTFTLTGADGQLVIKGKIDSKNLKVGDEFVKLPVAASEKDGRLTLPLRLIAQRIGDITWDGERSLVLVRYDYNTLNKLDVAAIDSNEPVRAEVQLNSGFEPPSDYTAISGPGMTDQLFEKRQNSQLVAVGYGDAIADHNLIEPVHDGYRIVHIRADKPYYGIGEDYVYWIESAADASDPVWYLYVQPRNKSTEPVCVDEIQADNAAFVKDTLWHDAAFDNGRLLWTRPNLDKQCIELCYYDAASGESKVLDRLQPKPAGTALAVLLEITLGERDAVLSYSKKLETNRYYGTLTRYDLASGKASHLSQGYNLNDPTIIGNTLFAVAMPKMGSYVDLEHPNADNSLNRVSNSLWAYDLKKNEWRYAITANGMALDAPVEFGDPSPLDDTHVIVNFYGNDAGVTDLLVLDVTSGSLHPVIDKNSDPWRYGLNAHEEDLMKNDEHLLITFCPINDRGYCLAERPRYSEDNPYYAKYTPVYVSMQFTW